MNLKSLGRIGREALVNFALPYLVYSFVQPRFGDVNALIASSGPLILWSVVEFARHRRAGFGPAIGHGDDFDVRQGAEAGDVPGFHVGARADKTNAYHDGDSGESARPFS